MIRALVLTHGRLGDELIRVVELFLGPVAGMEALSNADLSAADLTAAVGRWLAASEDPALILVDDRGGSCATAARLAAAGGAARVVTGVNLAMLLGFASWRESLALPDLVDRLLSNGREAIDEMSTEL